MQVFTTEVSDSNKYGLVIRRIGKNFVVFSQYTELYNTRDFDLATKFIEEYKGE